MARTPETVNALRHELGIPRTEPAAEAVLGVECPDHPLLGRRTLRGHHPHLPGKGHRVAEGVVALDQPVAHRDEVEAFEVDRPAHRGDAGELAGTGEGARQAPMNCATVVLASRREDLEAQIGHRLQEAAD